jgi:hypothetical protein
MRTRLLITLIFCTSFLVSTKAQDTNAPAMMSQHAYDSTLRALKKATEAKHPDTVKQQVITPVIKNDTGKHIVPVTPDTAHKGHVITEVTVKPKEEKMDTAKKKVRYSPTGYLSLSYGEAFPSGNFSSGAFPTKGGVVSFTAAFPGIVSRYGIIFKVDYGFNRLDKVRYLDSLKSQSGDPNLAFTMKDDATNYTYKTAMMGLFYTYSLKKVSIDARFLCGIMIATMPGTNVNIYDYGDLSTLMMVSYTVSGTGFALDEGLSVRYHALPLICFSLGIDNLSASTSFITAGSGITANPNGVEVQTPAQTNSVTQSFHLFSLNLGVAYTISAKKGGN